MCLGYALTVHRFAVLPHRTASARLIARPIVAVVAAIFVAGVLAAQAQESIEPDILPSLAEPPPVATESLPSTSARSCLRVGTQRAFSSSVCPADFALRVATDGEGKGVAAA